MTKESKQDTDCKHDNWVLQGKHSRSIFAETITEMCQKNGFYEE